MVAAQNALAATLFAAPVAEAMKAPIPMPDLAIHTAIHFAEVDHPAMVRASGARVRDTDDLAWDSPLSASRFSTLSSTPGHTRR